jgi:hypothetical protein
MEELCGVIGFSLIPTPCPKALCPPATQQSIIINNTIPNGVNIPRIPDPNLLFQKISEDVFRVVFIL